MSNEEKFGFESGEDVSNVPTYMNEPDQTPLQPYGPYPYVTLEEKIADYELGVASVDLAAARAGKTAIESDALASEEEILAARAKEQAELANYAAARRKKQEWSEKYDQGVVVVAQKESKKRNTKKIILGVSIAILIALLVIPFIFMAVRKPVEPTPESPDVSLFAEIKSEYILPGNYVLTKIDDDVIGMGTNAVGLNFPCTLNLNGYTLDLNGRTFSITASQGAIAVKNGTIKNGKFFIYSDDGTVLLDTVVFDGNNSDTYRINSTNSEVTVARNVDKGGYKAESFNMNGGVLRLSGGCITNELTLQSSLIMTDNSKIGEVIVAAADKQILVQDSEIGDIHAQESVTVFGDINSCVFAEKKATVTIGNDANIEQILADSPRTSVIVCEDASVNELMVNTAENIAIGGDVQTIDVLGKCDALSTVKGSNVGEITFQGGSDANADIRGNVNVINIDNGKAKVNIGKHMNSPDYSGGRVNTVNVNEDGATLTLENCAHIDTLNSNSTEATIELKGDVAQVNIENGAPIDIMYCSIVSELNVNSPAKVVLGGTVYDFNLNSDAVVASDESSYIKFLNIAEDTAASVNINGKVAVITDDSIDAVINMKYDAEVLAIDFGTGVDESKVSNISKNEKYESYNNLTDEQKEAIAALMKIPAVYVDSDCADTGFIIMTPGGERPTEDNQETIPVGKKKHQYSYRIIKPAGPGVEGIGEYYCTECGDSYTVVIPARAVIVDVATIVDLLGLALEPNEYHFALDDGTGFVVEEGSIGDISEYIGEVNDGLDISVVNKGYIHLTIEEAAIYGDIQLDLKYLKNRTAIPAKYADIIPEDGDTTLLVQIVLTGSKAYINCEYNGKPVTKLADIQATIDEYLEPIGITSSDIVAIVNTIRHISDLKETYAPYIDKIVGALGENVVKIISALRLSERIDGVQSTELPGGDYQFDIDWLKLADNVDGAGEETVSTILDASYGKGFTRTAIEYVGNITNLTIGTVVDDIILVSDNFGMDKESLFNDISFIIATIAEQFDVDYERLYNIMGTVAPSGDQVLDIRVALTKYENTTLYELIFGFEPEDFDEYIEFIEQKQSFDNNWVKTINYIAEASDITLEEAIERVAVILKAYLKIDMGKDVLATFTNGIRKLDGVAEIGWLAGSNKLPYAMSASYTMDTYGANVVYNSKTTEYNGEIYAHDHDAVVVGSDKGYTVSATYNENPNTFAQFICEFEEEVRDTYSFALTIGGYGSLSATTGKKLDRLNLTIPNYGIDEIEIVRDDKDYRVFVQADSVYSVEATCKDDGSYSIDINLDGQTYFGAYTPDGHAFGVDINYKKFILNGKYNEVDGGAFTMNVGKDFTTVVTLSDEENKAVIDYKDMTLTGLCEANGNKFVGFVKVEEGIDIGFNHNTKDATANACVIVNDFAYFAGYELGDFAQCTFQVPGKVVTLKATRGTESNTAELNAFNHVVSVKHKHAADAEPEYYATIKYAKVVTIEASFGMELGGSLSVNVRGIYYFSAHCDLAHETATVHIQNTPGTNYVDVARKGTIYNLDSTLTEHIIALAMDIADWTFDGSIRYDTTKVSATRSIVGEVVTEVASLDVLTNLVNIAVKRIDDSYKVQLKLFKDNWDIAVSHDEKDVYTIGIIIDGESYNVVYDTNAAEHTIAIDIDRDAFELYVNYNETLGGKFDLIAGRKKQVQIVVEQFADGDYSADIYVNYTINKDARKLVINLDHTIATEENDDIFYVFVDVNKEVVVKAKYGSTYGGLLYVEVGGHDYVDISCDLALDYAYAQINFTKVDTLYVSYDKGDYKLTANLADHEISADHTVLDGGNVYTFEAIKNYTEVGFTITNTSFEINILNGKKQDDKIFAKCSKDGGVEFTVMVDGFSYVEDFKVNFGEESSNAVFNFNTNDFISWTIALAYRKFTAVLKNHNITITDSTDGTYYVEIENNGSELVLTYAGLDSIDLYLNILDAYTFDIEVGSKYVKANVSIIDTVVVDVTYDDGMITLGGATKAFNHYVHGTYNIDDGYFDLVIEKNTTSVTARHNEKGDLLNVEVNGNAVNVRVQREDKNYYVYVGVDNDNIMVFLYDFDEADEELEIPAGFGVGVKVIRDKAKKDKLNNFVFAYVVDDGKVDDCYSVVYIDTVNNIDIEFVFDRGNGGSAKYVYKDVNYLTATCDLENGATVTLDLSAKKSYTFELVYTPIDDYGMYTIKWNDHAKYYKEFVSFTDNWKFLGFGYEDVDENKVVASLKKFDILQVEVNYNYGKYENWAFNGDFDKLRNEYSFDLKYKFNDLASTHSGKHTIKYTAKFEYSEADNYIFYKDSYTTTKPIPEDGMVSIFDIVRTSGNKFEYDNGEFTFYNMVNGITTKLWNTNEDGIGFTFFSSSFSVEAICSEEYKKIAFTNNAFYASYTYRAKYDMDLAIEYSLVDDEDTTLVATLYVTTENRVFVADVWSVHGIELNGKYYVDKDEVAGKLVWKSSNNNDFTVDFDVVFSVDTSIAVKLADFSNGYTYDVKLACNQVEKTGSADVEYDYTSWDKKKTTDIDLHATADEDSVIVSLNHNGITLDVIAIEDVQVQVDLIHLQNNFHAVLYPDWSFSTSGHAAGYDMEVSFDDDGFCRVIDARVWNDAQEDYDVLVKYYDNEDYHVTFTQTLIEEITGNTGCIIIEIAEEDGISLFEINLKDELVFGYKLHNADDFDVHFKFVTKVTSGTAGGPYTIDKENITKFTLHKGEDYYKYEAAYQAYSYEKHMYIVDYRLTWTNQDHFECTFSSYNYVFSFINKYNGNEPDDYILRMYEHNQSKNIEYDLNVVAKFDKFIGVRNFFDWKNLFYKEDLTWADVVAEAESAYLKLHEYLLGFDYSITGIANFIESYVLKFDVTYDECIPTSRANDYYHYEGHYVPEEHKYIESDEGAGNELYGKGYDHVPFDNDFFLIFEKDEFVISHDAALKWDPLYTGAYDVVYQFVEDKDGTMHFENYKVFEGGKAQCDYERIYSEPIVEAGKVVGQRYYTVKNVLSDHLSGDYLYYEADTCVNVDEVIGGKRFTEIHYFADDGFDKATTRDEIVEHFKTDDETTQDSWIADTYSMFFDAHEGVFTSYDVGCESVGGERHYKILKTELRKDNIAYGVTHRSADTTRVVRDQDEELNYAHIQYYSYQPESNRFKWYIVVSVEDDQVEDDYLDIYVEKLDVGFADDASVIILRANFVAMVDIGSFIALNREAIKGGCTKFYLENYSDVDIHYYHYDGMKEFRLFMPQYASQGLSEKFAEALIKGYGQYLDDLYGRRYDRSDIHAFDWWVNEFIDRVVDINYKRTSHNGIVDSITFDFDEFTFDFEADYAHEGEDRYTLNISKALVGKVIDFIENPPIESVKRSAYILKGYLIGIKEDIDDPKKEVLDESIDPYLYAVVEWMFNVYDSYISQFIIDALQAIKDGKFDFADDLGTYDANFALTTYSIDHEFAGFLFNMGETHKYEAYGYFDGNNLDAHITLDSVSAGHVEFLSAEADLDALTCDVKYDTTYFAGNHYNFITGQREEFEAHTGRFTSTRLYPNEKDAHARRVTLDSSDMNYGYDVIVTAYYEGHDIADIYGAKVTTKRYEAMASYKDGIFTSYADKFVSGEAVRFFEANINYINYTGNLFYDNECISRYVRTTAFTDDRFETIRSHSGVTIDVTEVPVLGADTKSREVVIKRIGGKDDKWKVKFDSILSHIGAYDDIKGFRFDNQLGKGHDLMVTFDVDTNSYSLTFNTGVGEDKATVLDVRTFNDMAYNYFMLDLAPVKGNVQIEAKYDVDEDAYLNVTVCGTTYVEASCNFTDKANATVRFDDDNINYITVNYNDGLYSLIGVVYHGHNISGSYDSNNNDCSAYVAKGKNYIDAKYVDGVASLDTVVYHDHAVQGSYNFSDGSFKVTVDKADFAGRTNSVVLSYNDEAHYLGVFVNNAQIKVEIVNDAKDGYKVYVNVYDETIVVIKETIDNTYSVEVTVDNDVYFFASFNMESGSAVKVVVNEKTYFEAACDHEANAHAYYFWNNSAKDSVKVDLVDGDFTLKAVVFYGHEVQATYSDGYFTASIVKNDSNGYTTSITAIYSENIHRAELSILNGVIDLVAENSAIDGYRAFVKASDVTVEVKETIDNTYSVDVIVGEKVKVYVAFSMENKSQIIVKVGGKDYVSAECDLVNGTAFATINFNNKAKDYITCTYNEQTGYILEGNIAGHGITGKRDSEGHSLNIQQYDNSKRYTSVTFTYDKEYHQVSLASVDYSELVCDYSLLITNKVGGYYKVGVVVKDVMVEATHSLADPNYSISVLVGTSAGEAWPDGSIVKTFVSCGNSAGDTLLVEVLGKEYVSAHCNRTTGMADATITFNNKAEDTIIVKYNEATGYTMDAKLAKHYVNASCDTNGGWDFDINMNGKNGKKSNVYIKHFADEHAVEVDVNNEGIQVDLYNRKAEGYGLNVIVYETIVNITHTIQDTYTVEVIVDNDVYFFASYDADDGAKLDVNVNELDYVEIACNFKDTAWADIYFNNKAGDKIELLYEDGVFSGNAKLGNHNVTLTKCADDLSDISAIIAYMAGKSRVAYLSFKHTIGGNKNFAIQYVPARIAISANEFNGRYMAGVKVQDVCLKFVHSQDAIYSVQVTVGPETLNNVFVSYGTNYGGEIVVTLNKVTYFTSSCDLAKGHAEAHVQNVDGRNTADLTYDNDIFTLIVKAEGHTLEASYDWETYAFSATASKKDARGKEIILTAKNDVLDGGRVGSFKVQIGKDTYYIEEANGAAYKLDVKVDGGKYRVKAACNSANEAYSFSVNAGRFSTRFASEGESYDFYITDGDNSEKVWFHDDQDYGFETTLNIVNIVTKENNMMVYGFKYLDGTQTYTFADENSYIRVDYVDYHNMSYYVEIGKDIVKVDFATLDSGDGNFVETVNVDVNGFTVDTMFKLFYEDDAFIGAEASVDVLDCIWNAKFVDGSEGIDTFFRRTVSGEDAIEYFAFSTNAAGEITNFSFDAREIGDINFTLSDHKFCIPAEFLKVAYGLSNYQVIDGTVSFDYHVGFGKDYFEGSFSALTYEEDGQDVIEVGLSFNDYEVSLKAIAEVIEKNDKFSMFHSHARLDMVDGEQRDSYADFGFYFQVDSELTAKGAYYPFMDALIKDLK